MRILAVESSAKVASCAILDGEKLVGEIFLDSGLVHSTILAPAVKSLLDFTRLSANDIDLFAVSNGPGSFTGVRIGVSLVKGMALPLNKKTLGVSTLYAMAFNAIDQKDTIVCSCMDARKDQLYAALFRIKAGKPFRITEDTAISAQDLFLKVKDLKKKDMILLGDGANIFYNFINNNFEKREIENIRLVCLNFRYQSARSVALAARTLLKGETKAGDAQSLQINYLRPSQAERERIERLSS